MMHCGPSMPGLTISWMRGGSERIKHADAKQYDYFPHLFVRSIACCFRCAGVRHGLVYAADDAGGVLFLALIDGRS